MTVGTEGGREKFSKLNQNVVNLGVGVGDEGQRGGVRNQKLLKLDPIEGDLNNGIIIAI